MCKELEFLQNSIIVLDFGMIERPGWLWWCDDPGHLTLGQRLKHVHEDLATMKWLWRWSNVLQGLRRVNTEVSILMRSMLSGYKSEVNTPTVISQWQTTQRNKKTPRCSKCSSHCSWFSASPCWPSVLQLLTLPLHRVGQFLRRFVRLKQSLLAVVSLFLLKDVG